MERSTDVVVIGAGQAGLSTAYHLARLGVGDYVVLDADEAPGGAWQHRWHTLTMRDVHGVASLPGSQVPPRADDVPARTFVPGYFDSYEQTYGLHVRRPVRVRRVDEDDDGQLLVHTEHDTWTSRAVINATGTWRSPFVPHYPGKEAFAGRQVHTVEYDGPEAFADQDVVVVGGGASAVQILGEIAATSRTLWVTRRPPVWRHVDFNRGAGREAVALVEDRVRRGLPPESVVSVTGLALRPQEAVAAAAGAYVRHPMFSRIEPSGVRWDDGTFAAADAIVWATGFRPSVAHLAPLGLREPSGGIRLVARAGADTPTTVARDHRVQMVGYGPSASTIGANRAGRVAALAALRTVEEARAAAA